MYRLTNKERFDILTMRYFIPLNKFKTRITKQDEFRMAQLSSRGIQPDKITRGFTNLLWGKTYRDEQITSYKRDIELGYFTKIEIISSFPKKLQPWITDKIKDIPYDVESRTNRMIIGMYEAGER